MTTFAPIWNQPAALATAFAVGARESVHVAVEQLRETDAGRAAANAKVALEQAATQVAAALLPPEYRLADVESYLRDDRTLPELMPVTPRQIKILSGSEPLTSAYARASLGHTATLRLLNLRLQQEREDAYAEYREDEPTDIALYLVDFFLEAQVELGRALDDSAVAEIVSITAPVHDERQQRGVLRLVAA